MGGVGFVSVLCICWLRMTGGTEKMAVKYLISFEVIIVINAYISMIVQLNQYYIKIIG